MDGCVHVCMHVWSYVCLNVWMHACMFVPKYECIHICQAVTYVRVYVCVYIYMYIYIYIFYVYVCMCMYIYIYACICTHAHSTQTHTHTHSLSVAFVSLFVWFVVWLLCCDEPASSSQAAPAVVRISRAEEAASCRGFGIGLLQSFCGVTISDSPCLVNCLELRICRVCELRAFLSWGFALGCRLQGAFVLVFRHQLVREMIVDDVCSWGRGVIVHSFWMRCRVLVDV